MFEYTYRNHFRFGYDGQNDFRPRVSEHQKFTAQYGRCQEDIFCWKAANERSARQIYRFGQGSIYILLSGGMDSEVCLRSFVDQEIPVKTVTLRYKDIDQSKELSHVERLVKEWNLDHEYVDIKLLEFIRSADFYDTVDPVKCVSPIVGAQLWLANRVVGTPVIAQGEVHLKKRVPDNYVAGVSPYLPSSWDLYESERLCSMYMNFIIRNKPAVPGFFQYLPEQFYTYMKYNPILSDLVENKIPGKLGTRTSKNLMLAQFYPDIPIREKLHGWEAIQDLHDVLREELARRFPLNDQYFRLEYQDILEMIAPISKEIP